MRTWNPLQLIAARSGGPAALPALATCRSLVGLLAGLQQHRGLSAGWLAGDESFSPPMLRKRREIEALFPVLRAGFAAETAASCPCFTVNDWRLCQFAWREILEEMGPAALQQNIERHNRLIARVLAWLAALGESRIELPAGSRLPPGAVRNFTSRLPALAECLGQARALGSSVAARGVCSPVERVRLGHLVRRAEGLLEQAAAGDRGGRPAAAAGQLIGAMGAMVRSELLVRTGLGISSKGYFNTATQAIDAVFAWMESAAAEVEGGLRRGQDCRAVPGPAFG